MIRKSDELLQQIISHKDNGTMTPEFRDLLFKYSDERAKEKLEEIERICNNSDFKI